MPPLPASPSYQAMLDRRRESIAASSALRSHPFLSMGPKAVTGEDDDAASYTPRRLPRSSSNAAMTASPQAENHPRTTRSHQRALSESVSSAFTPPKRGLGIVRKLSFRSKEKSATPTGQAASHPLGGNSADDALEVLSPKDKGDAADAPELSHTRTTTMSHPARRRRSPRLSPGPEPIAEAPETHISESATPEQPRTTHSKVQPIPPASGRSGAAPVPRSSPPRSSSLRRSVAKTSHRNTLGSSRRAEREWKAKLAALSLAPPSQSSPSPERPPAHTSGPRPPPRRVAKPFAGDDKDNRPLGNSPSSSSTMSRSKRSYDSLSTMAAPSTSLSAFGQALSLISRSASSSSGKTRSRASRGSPRRHRTPLSPIEQEPLTPELDMVMAKAADVPVVRPLPSIPTYEPSRKDAFAPAVAPSPPAWSPTNRVVVAHSSVPDLRTVPLSQSPPPTRTGSAGTAPGESTPDVRTQASTPVPECQVATATTKDNEKNTFTHVRRRSRDLLLAQVHGLPRTTSLAAVTGPEEMPDDDRAGYKLRRAYDLTPGLERGGLRPRKTGLPMEEMQRWLHEAAR